MKKLNVLALICVFSTASFTATFAQTDSKDAKKEAKKTNDTKMDNKKIDATYVVNASDDGMFEVQAAQLAKTNASSEKVKELANMMATDHAKANAELKSTAAKKSITVAAKLGANNQKKFDKLTKLKGAEFDKEYADMMVTAHKNAIDLFQKEADNGTDADLKAWAAGKIATLKHHLEMAQSTYDAVK